MAHPHATSERGVVDQAAAGEGGKERKRGMEGNRCFFLQQNVSVSHSAAATNTKPHTVLTHKIVDIDGDAYRVATIVLLLESCCS